MEKKFLKTTAISVGIFILTIAVSGNLAMAGKWGDTPSGLDLVIEIVYVDLDNNLIFIYGKHFNNGTLPVVEIGGTGLFVLDYTNNMIKAGLPSGIEPGNYLLKITTGNSTHQYDIFSVSIGAVVAKGIPVYTHPAECGFDPSVLHVDSVTCSIPDVGAFTSILRGYLIQ